jgi:hypothetical protein
MSNQPQVRRPTRLPSRDPDVPGWIHWPIRVVAVIVVVPVRLAWEVLTAVGSAVQRWSSSRSGGSCCGRSCVPRSGWCTT